MKDPPRPPEKKRENEQTYGPLRRGSGSYFANLNGKAGDKKGAVKHMAVKLISATGRGSEKPQCKAGPGQKIKNHNAGKPAMARPSKLTVEYFPHDTKQKKTLFILKSRYGNSGYSFWFQLLELLGASAGHYYNCNLEDCTEYLSAYALLEWEKCVEILNTLSKLGAINAGLWENKIIWSDNFVERLRPIYEKRKTELPRKPTLEDVFGEKTNAVDMLLGKDGEKTPQRNKGSKGKKEKEDSLEPPQAVDSKPEDGAAVMEILLIKRDGIFPVRQSYVDELRESFPGLDVLQVLRNIRQYYRDKPLKRKTKRGIRGSISTWMAKDQDAGKNLLKEGIQKPRREAEFPQHVICRFCENETTLLYRGDSCRHCNETYYEPRHDGTYGVREPIAADQFEGLADRMKGIA